MAEKSFFKSLSDDGNERLRFKITIVKGKVADILVQYETLISGKWVPIIRYDCAHGFFHRDKMNPDGSKEKTAIPINRLEDAINYAEQELKDNWENHKNLYLSKTDDE